MVIGWGTGENRKKGSLYYPLDYFSATGEPRKSRGTPCRSVAWRAGLKTVEGTEPE